MPSTRHPQLHRIPPKSKTIIPLYSFYAATDFHSNTRPRLPSRGQKAAIPRLTAPHPPYQERADSLRTPATATTTTSATDDPASRDGSCFVIVSTAGFNIYKPMHEKIRRSKWLRIHRKYTPTFIIAGKIAGKIVKATYSQSNCSMSLP